MSERLQIVFNGKRISVKKGEQIHSFLKRQPHRGKFSPVGAMVNNRLVDLNYPVSSSAEVRTIDLSERPGMDIYRRSASTILFAAMQEISPTSRLVVGQSIGDGYFFEVFGTRPNVRLISRIEEVMKKIVRANIPIVVEHMIVEEALRLMEQSGQSGTKLLLEQSRRADVPVVRLKKYVGYAHGPMVYRTGTINNFRIYPYRHGLVLEFPDDKGKLPKVDASPFSKLFSTYVETKRWGGLLKVENISQLNQHCIRGDVSELVRVSEALHEKKIAEIADIITKEKNKRLILVAGPSCAGKTTFAKRLCVHLKLNGLEPVSLSIDNYYVNREDSPQHPDGTYNFECLEALKVEDFSRDVELLFKGKEVFIPSYNFGMGCPDPMKKKKMRLGKNHVLITEGIHGLNDALTPTLHPNNKFKVYVSPLTQLCIDEHNRIFTTDTRLIRRIVRDRMFRNTNADLTISGWKSVRAGENSYIFPYQETSDVVFNSALFYEHAVLKMYAERFLMEVPRSSQSFMEVNRLTRFFSLFVPILEREVPYTSILREFIGGSGFSY